jgi:hypothetical protein
MDVLVYVFGLMSKGVLDAPGSLAIGAPAPRPLVVIYGREHDHDRGVGRVEASGQRLASCKAGQGPGDESLGRLGDGHWDIQVVLAPPQGAD